MNKSSKLILIFISIFVMDRFLFMPDRLDTVWEFETGNYIGDPISKNQNIKVINNYEIMISKNGESSSFYVVGCYLGNLYLLEKESLKYNRYIKFEGSGRWN